jgi:hypothetical protein
MGLITSIDVDARRIYLDPLAAVGGVITFHPTVDLYPEYRTLRRTVEAYRPCDIFMRASGNEPKNQSGSKRTPRFTRLLLGAKLVIPAGIDRINVTGELLTDDGSDPFDRSLVTSACFIDYTPAEAEIIAVSTSGNEYTLEQIAAAILAAAQATPIHADMRKTNNVAIHGDGTEGNKFRSVLVA